MRGWRSGASLLTRPMMHGLCFFFFQAEDGIRDYKVTGVQTCALPIWDAVTLLSGPGWVSLARKDDRAGQVISERGGLATVCTDRAQCRSRICGGGTRIDRKSVV